MQPPIFDPYCGPAPLPTTLWTAWNFDPVLIAGILALGVALWHRADPATAGGHQRRVFSLASCVVLFLAFVSPLCALASALFSARVFHHILLVSCAAPLIALALPRSGRWAGNVPLGFAFLVHTALLWVWHAPGPYAFALRTSGNYWIMELTLLASAVWLWQGLLASDATGRKAGGVIAAALGSIVQMGMLGALLTFARTPLYAAHQTTTQAFGLMPIEDQQLAGVLMWVPAALPYLILALWRLASLFPEATPTTSLRHPQS